MAESTPEFEGTSRFRVVRRIGGGGMGVVYEAHDARRGARVALKTLRAIEPSSLLLFKSEFRALADIQHDNLISLGELIEEQGQWFFTMELVVGTDFLSHVRPGVVSESIADTPSQVQGAETLPAASDPRDSMVGAGAHGAGTLSEERLRGALAQLARGLYALHAAGKVHRDIKPTNVLVSAAGRVVLVDFGLVIDANVSPHTSGQGIAGTVPYMAPEQAQASPVGPEADWYGVGTMLYEALTGQLPFHGSAFEVLSTKQRALPPAPSEVAQGVPADLEALCMDLLAIDPAARPTGAQVLERLGGAGRVSLVPTSSPQDADFVGRELEMAELGRAYEATARGAGVTVYVDGESGLGKTVLVRHFADALARQDGPAPLVLTGRCYERESVPYKAIDGVIDALSRALERMPAADIEAVLPAQPGLLADVFPVLARVRAISQAAQPQLAALDPTERRARVFAALRELFVRLARRSRVVVVIDDLQWADADSLLCLREIMRPPGAPAILLLATVRTTAHAAPPAGPAPSLPQSRLNVGSGAMPGDVRTLHLEPLGAEAARELAERLIRRAFSDASRPPESSAAAIAQEGGGHPLFIDELVRHAAVVSRPPSRLRLDDALWERIAAKAPRARKLLSVLSLARGPLPRDAAARAAGFTDAAELDKDVGALRAEHLVRTTQRRDAVLLETYHDRVRQAVRAHLDEEAPALHETIALALEESDLADFESLAEHWRGAGALDKAGRYAAEAADQALASLAFDRAARLYEWALELAPDDADAGGRTLRLAEALSASGRGAEAADAFLAAADAASAPDEAIELRRRAAHQLLMSGHTESGLAALRDVLTAVGLEIPASRTLAQASLALRRTQLRVFGLGFKERREEDVPRRDLQRIDVCWTVGLGLGLVDTLRGAEFQTRGLLHALSAGEPRRIARALAVEAAYVAAAGDDARERWEELLDRARTVARRVGDPRIDALVLASEGLALYLSGYWLGARRRCEEAARVVRDSCVGATWELATSTLFSLRALSWLGGIARLREEVPERLGDAEARGDLFTTRNLQTGLLNFVWLAGGDPAAARRHIDEATRDAPAGTHKLLQSQEVQARAQADLYDGDAERAYHRVAEAWPGLDRGGLMRIQNERVILDDIRARAAVAYARRQSTRRRELLDDATRHANDVARTGAPWALAIAALLRGCVAHARGEPQRAVASFDQAARDADACDMALHAAVARLRLGKLIGGDEGRAMVTRAREWMSGQAIVEPEAIASVLAP